MRKLMFALLALAISLFGTQCWASTCVHTSPAVPVSCTNTFSPADNTGTYFFGNNGALVITFPVVLTTFTLTATVNTVPLPFDPNEFPVGTVEVTYCNGQQDRYDFTGTGGSGMNGLPLKGTDFQGLIHIQLSYCTSQTVHTPAFAHAPDGFTTFIEDILNFYSTLTAPTFPPGDPTMDGDTPGISSIAAADKPLSGTATFCSLTTTRTNVPSGQKPQIEVTYKIVSGSDCSGTGLRDKTAQLFVATDSGGFSVPALPNVEGNKFHWDNTKGLNEFDFSTEGLVSGRTYKITVISELVSSPSVDFVAP